MSEIVHGVCFCRSVALLIAEIKTIRQFSRLINILAFLQALLEGLKKFVTQQCGLSEAGLWVVKSHRKTKGLAFQIKIKILTESDVSWFSVTWELERVTVNVGCCNGLICRMEERTHEWWLWWFWWLWWLWWFWW